MARLVPAFFRVSTAVATRKEAILEDAEGVASRNRLDGLRIQDLIAGVGRKWKPTFILDCSVAMAWCFSDERTPETARIQDRMALEAALVPGHWFLEVANVLAMAEKRQRISPDDSLQFVEQLSVLDIEVDEEVLSAEHFSPFPAAMPQWPDEPCTAAYLDLAHRVAPRLWRRSTTPSAQRRRTSGCRCSENDPRRPT